MRTIRVWLKDGAGVRPRGRGPHHECEVAVAYGRGPVRAAGNDSRDDGREVCIPEDCDDLCQAERRA